MSNNGFGLLLGVILIIIVVWFLWDKGNQRSGFVRLSPLFPDNQQDEYVCTWSPYPKPWLKKIVCPTYDISGNNTYYATSDSPGCRQMICNSPTGCPPIGCSCPG